VVFFSTALFLASDTAIFQQVIAKMASVRAPCALKGHGVMLLVFGRTRRRVDRGWYPAPDPVASVTSR
jgi:hypothetical protein